MGRAWGTFRRAPGGALAPLPSVARLGPHVSGGVALALRLSCFGLAGRPARPGLLAAVGAGPKGSVRRSVRRSSSSSEPRVSGPPCDWPAWRGRDPCKSVLLRPAAGVGAGQAAPPGEVRLSWLPPSEGLPVPARLPRLKGMRVGACLLASECGGSPGRCPCFPPQQTVVRSFGNGAWCETTPQHQPKGLRWCVRAPRA